MATGQWVIERDADHGEGRVYCLRARPEIEAKVGRQLWTHTTDPSEATRFVHYADAMEAIEGRTWGNPRIVRRPA